LFLINIGYEIVGKAYISRYFKLWKNYSIPQHNDLSDEDVTKCSYSSLFRQSQYSEFKELKKPLTYLKNGCGCWYTCLLYPGMEPTNNLAEQAIRKHVIMRKIIGCFKSVKGESKRG